MCNIICFKVYNLVIHNFLNLWVTFKICTHAHTCTHSQEETKSHFPKAILTCKIFPTQEKNTLLYNYAEELEIPLAQCPCCNPCLLTHNKQAEWIAHVAYGWHHKDGRKPVPCFVHLVMILSSPKHCEVGGADKASR